MRSLAVTQQNLDNQRETVKEEKRLRVDNQPYAATFGDGTTWPFDSAGCFAYAHTAIGSIPDLDAARLADVQAFFETYYAPNNATLVVVGDVKPVLLRQFVNAYFADIPSHAPPPPVHCKWTLAPGTVRREVADAHATLPAVMRFYRLVPHDHADTPALQLLSVILGQGESSRLNVTVVRRERAALQAGLFGLDERRGPGVLVAYGIANQGVPVQRLDSLIATQLDSVRRAGVTADELTRAKNTYRADFVHARETTFGRAEALEHYTLFHARTADINTDLERYLAVTAADVQRVAARYLDPANAVIVIVRPQATPARAGDTR
jgi:predicted Zn-dependent peptidase